MNETPLRIGNRLRIVVASDNSAIGFRAHDSAARLARRSRLGEVISHLVVVETLDEPDRRAETARQVSDADLIIITLSDGHALSPVVGKWADEWRTHRRPWSATLLVAVDHRSATLRQPPPAAELLRRAAIRCGMQFECWTIDWQGTGYEQCVGRLISRARTPLPEVRSDSRREVSGLSPETRAGDADVG